MKKIYSRLSTYSIYSISLTLIISVSLVFKSALADQETTFAPPAVQNVIIMISDGFAPAGVTLARYYKGDKLNLDSILSGTVRTRSTDSLITDSAAAGTAMATGYKTNNQVIGLHPENGTILKNIMEAAKEKNMATGLVATDEIIGATVASFSAHVKSRDMDDEIAKQQIFAGFDVMFGGGKKHFLPKSLDGSRNDGVNLLKLAQSYGVTVIDSYKDLKSIDASPVIGLFSKSKMDYEIDRKTSEQPSLKEMTAKALELLSKNKNGFVLMIEGSRLDHAAHGKDAAAFAQEILMYDETIGLVKEFINKNPNTLMVSTSDHGTGGITVGRDVNNKIAYLYHPEQLHAASKSISSLYNMLMDGESVDNLIKAFGLDFSNEQISEIKASTDPVYKILTLSNELSRTGWTTHGHTAVDVNLYSYGAGSELFRGNIDNTEIPQRVAKLLQVNLS